MYDTDWIDNARRERRRTKRILKEFPELWALRQEWYSCSVKICRAPAIRFLEDGIRISADMKTVKAYVITHLRVRDVTITDGGNTIIAVGNHTVDHPDALRALVYLELFSPDVRYVFLLEEGSTTPGRPWRIIIVKPPSGQRNFISYVTRLRAKQKQKSLPASAQ